MQLDECGVCGGDGIADGECDCDGNTVDALGVCGGDCTSDANGNGICDSDELAAARTALRNYDADATEDDGSCDFCSCAGESTGGDASGYTLTVEEHAVDIVIGETTYRVYVDLVNADDFLSSVYGNDADPLSIATESGFYNDTFGSTVASGINPAFFALVPTLVADSWITIGIDSQNTGEEVQISTVEDSAQPFVAALHTGSALDGQDIELNTQTGGAWYVLNGTPNGVPDANGRVLVMQLTTSAGLSGTLPVQIFENGDGTNDLRKTFTFDGTVHLMQWAKAQAVQAETLADVRTTRPRTTIRTLRTTTAAVHTLYLVVRTLLPVTTTLMRRTTTALAWNWMSAAYVAVTALPMAHATATATVLLPVTTATATA